MGKSKKKLIKEFFLVLFAVLIPFLYYILFIFDYDCCANDPLAGEHLSQQEVDQQKINLGRKLFFEKRLSRDNTVSCVNCHNPSLAFTDGKQFSEGVEGRLGFRNSPALLNLKDATSFMFDAEIKSLEEQAIVPIQDHAEMDLSIGELIEKLSSDPDYKKKAKLLYDREFDALVLTESLAAFQRSLVSNNSSFDKFYYSGDASSITANQLAGWKLFNEFSCIECHQLPNFTDHQPYNIGLYKDYGEDQGRFRVTHDSTDMGKFKTPSLRNIELTAPYMHDGSIKDLKGVILAHTWRGYDHPNKDSRVRNVKMTTEQQENIIEFLKTLTDTSYLISY